MNVIKDAKYKALFSLLDGDKSGEIEVKDLKKGPLSFLPESQMKQLIKFLDKDGDGKIDYKEFKTAMRKLDGGKKKNKW
jgi:Ca2+-binding EF-hand superfamily protein